MAGDWKALLLVGLCSRATAARVSMAVLRLFVMVIVGFRILCAVAVVDLDLAGFGFADED